jgi:hydrogenase nickel incorporation protein HypA/HybF
MHELSLARALLRQIEELRASRSSGTVRSARISVGEFSGVDAELLQLAFGRSTQGTSLECAQLVVETVPLEAHCRDCRTQFPVLQFHFVCPGCGGRATEVVRGEELMLESVTFEEVEP